MQDETKTKVLSRYQSSDSMTTSSSPLFVDECKLHKLSPLSDKMIDISWATPTQETDCVPMWRLEERVMGVCAHAPNS